MSGCAPQLGHWCVQAELRRRTPQLVRPAFPCREHQQSWLQLLPAVAFCELRELAWLAEVGVGAAPGMST